MDAKKRICCLTFCFAVFAQAEAAKRYWVGLAWSNWNNTSNWSTSSGGLGGSSVPGSNDTAYFDGGGIGKCSLDVAINIKRLEINSGYIDTLKQNGQTITIGTSGFTQAAGVFFGNTGNITNSGIFSLTGGVFTSTASTLQVSGNFTFSGGTFNHNNGLVKFATTNTITGSITFYQLEFNAVTSNRTFTIASGTILTVNNTLTISGSTAVILNTGDIHAKKDISITNTDDAGGGTATITINGTTKQNFYGTTSSADYECPNIVINKSDTLVFHDIITAIKDWTYTAGVINAGTSTVYFSETKTISGSHELNNVVFYSPANYTYTISTGTVLTVKGTLTTSGTNNVGINTGTIHAKGNITISNTSSGGGGTGTIVINGTGSQFFTGATVAQNGRLCSIQINKTSGTLTLSNFISVVGDWTYTAGAVDAGTSTVYMLGTKTISGTHSLHHAVFTNNSSANVVVTISSGTTFTLLGNLTLGAGSWNLTTNTGTIHAKGNITSTNTSTTSGGTATLIINGTGTQTMTGSGIAGSGKFCNVTIDKSSGTLSLVDIITFDKNFIYTAGTVSGGTSTCAFYGSGTFDPENSSYSVPFYDVIIAASRTLSGKLTVLHDLTINTSQTLTNGGFDINIGRDWIDNGTFSTSGGYVKFDGTAAQTISKTAGSSETFKKLWIANTNSSTVTLNNPVIVTDTFKISQGKVVATATNLLTLNDNAGVLGGGDLAYVSGPMKKIGNETITFPLGNTSLSSGAYHPLGITAPSSTTDAFTAEYKVANPLTVYGTTLSDSISAVSTCEYWVLTRNVGSSNVKPTLGWNTNMCLTNSTSDLEVAIWNGSKWNNLGASAKTIVPGTQSGTLTANLNATYSTSPLSFSINNKVDYAILKKKLDGGYYIATTSNLRFKFDEEYHDGDGILSFKIIKTSNNQDVTPSVQNFLKPVRFGDNRYGYDLSLYSFASGYYILEVTNEKSEKMYLRFKI